MTDRPVIGYIFSSTVELTRVCKYSCGYCPFGKRSEGLPTLADLSARFREISRNGAVEVVLVAGEAPQEFPEIQLMLKREGCFSFSEYLQKACRQALDERLLPVISCGFLERHELQALSSFAASVRIDILPGNLDKPGEAHEKARGRNQKSGREMIERAHALEIPYHLDFLLGIGESDEDRLRVIGELGAFCAADPFLQDVRVIPFQPLPGTELRARPPLGFEAVGRVTEALRKVFPVHAIGIAPHLFHRYPELVEHGLNDLGPLPFSTGDPMMTGFPIPGPEILKNRLAEVSAIPLERLPLTTRAAREREFLVPTLAHGGQRVQDRNGGAVSLIDNDHCFVCGQGNPQGLHLNFTKLDSNSCSVTWVAGPSFQGYAGIVHGGILSTLLDEVMAQCLLELGLRVVTADMRVRFLKPAPIGFPLTVVGNWVGSRSRIHFTTGSVQAPDGTVFAQAEGRFSEC